MTAPITAVTYLAGDCCACRQLIFGWTTPTRPGRWMHQNDADQWIGGWHTAWPVDGTQRRITAAEYLNLGGPL